MSQLPTAYSLRPLPHWRLVSESTWMPGALEAFVLHTILPRVGSFRRRDSQVPRPPTVALPFTSLSQVSEKNEAFTHVNSNGRSLQQSQLTSGRLGLHQTSPCQPTAGCQSCEHSQTRRPWKISVATYVWGIYSDSLGNGTQQHWSKVLASSPGLGVQEVSDLSIHAGQAEETMCTVKKWSGRIYESEVTLFLTN